MPTSRKRRMLSAAIVLCGLSFADERAPLASFVNYTAREINVKIVYHGPFTAGLAENLRYIYGRTSPEARSKLISLESETGEWTLFFDFLPPTLGAIKGFKVRVHLYTVPGKINYASSRKLILKGVDGVVFVADAKKPRATLRSWNELKRNLAANGFDWKAVPLVVQLDSRRQLPDPAVSVTALKRRLGLDRQPVFVANPVKGNGVFATLKAIVKQVSIPFERGDASTPKRPPKP